MKPLVWILVFILLLCACSGENLPDTGEPPTQVNPTSSSTPTAPVGAKDTPQKIESQTPTVTPTAKPTSTLTPTLVVTSTDYQNLVGQWSIYSNDEYGFSFEYPAIYDTQDFAVCKPRQRKSEDTEFTVRLGARSYLLVLKEEKSLEEYIEDLLKQFATGDPDFQLQARTDMQVGGQDAITIEYRFGGLGRYGTATAVKNGDTLFVFDLTAGAFCDPPQTPIMESSAYLHMIESFQFVEPGSAGLVKQTHWN